MNQPEPQQQPTDTSVPPPVQRYDPIIPIGTRQFRDLQRDAADMEAIRAWWSNTDPVTLVGEYQGDALAATLDALQRYHRQSHRVVD